MNSVRHLPCWLLLLALLCSASSGVAQALIVEDAQRVFPTAHYVLPLDGKVPGFLLKNKAGETLGYALRTGEVTPISAYSGKPIDTLIGLDDQGIIRGIDILHHEEPILIIGIADTDLQRFIRQFIGHSSQERIRVGAHNRDGYVGIDGISGATITTMVLASSVNKSIHQFTNAYGIPKTNTDSTASAVAHTLNSNSVDRRNIAVEPPEIPAWQLLWKERRLELIIVTVALLVLMTILFFQDWLVRRTGLFQKVRIAYLLFTLFFIGFYCSAQLSVVNLLAFFHNMAGGFSWDTLLIEPVVFLLWAFVAISIVLWGRGVYCGWLCPFGAAQDLVGKAVAYFGFEGYSFPQMVHERLWAIKYFILIALAGLSLDSMVHAAQLAEVEPFKTTFVLRFSREAPFVIYALALLAISAVNTKFYCKYLCPLGAGLSFVTSFSIFQWLRRRRDCGKPCQACAHQCQIAAIRPTGEIIANECHYCLECQVHYWDDTMCPPLVKKRKKREAKAVRQVDIIAHNN